MGGTIDAVLIGLSAKIAAKKSEKVLVCVLKCVGIYVLATVLEFILVVCITGIKYQKNNVSVLKECRLIHDRISRCFSSTVLF